MNTNTSAYLKRGKKALLMLAVKFCVAKAEPDLPSLCRSIAYYNQHYLMMIPTTELLAWTES
jgi:hypothetical protein